MTPAEYGLFAIVGLVLLVAGWPLARGKIAPNWLIGFRTPRLVNDERAWYPANRIAGRGLQVAGAVMVAVAGVLAALASVGTGVSPLVSVALLASPVFGMLLHLIIRVSLLVYDLDHPPVEPATAAPVETVDASESSAPRSRAARQPQRERS